VSRDGHPTRLVGAPGTSASDEVIDVLMLDLSVKTHLDISDCVSLRR
jgi:hypothetical protein